jgi:penicillin-binding protein 2D
MKRAAALHPSKHEFSPPPSGIVSARVDPDTGGLAGPYCPASRIEYFIDGTQPQGACPLHQQPFFDSFLENTVDRMAQVPSPPPPLR